MRSTATQRQAPRLFARSLARRLCRVLARAAAMVLPAAIVLSCSGGERGETRIELVSPDDPALPEIAWTEAVAESAPQRIISLIPSCTELLYALGLGDRLVGVGRWADHPADVEKLPRLGDVRAIKIEQILDLRPDLLLLFDSSADHAELLRQRGIRVVSPPTEAAQEILAGVKAVAGIVGVPERGEALVARLEADIAAVRESVKDLPAKRVLVAFERDHGLSVPVRSSFVHRMIEIAGGVNVTADVEAKGHFTYASPEHVVDWKPDVIIDLTVATGTNRNVDDAKRYWRKLGSSARVVLLDAPCVTRPGPRHAAGIRILADVIHDL